MKRPARDRPLLVDAAATLVGRGVGVAVSLATSVVVARIWGVEGKGLVSLLATATTLGVRLGVIGFDAAVPQFLLVRRANAGATLGTVLALASAAGIVSSILAHAALGLFGSSTRGDRGGSVLRGDPARRGDRAQRRVGEFGLRPNCCNL